MTSKSGEDSIGYDASLKGDQTKSSCRESFDKGKQVHVDHFDLFEIVEQASLGTAVQILMFILEHSRVAKGHMIQSFS